MQLRAKTLWSAILKEKFIFSFKSTLEVTAYNELDIKYSQWAWKLQEVLLNWRQRAGYQIESCDTSKIKSVVDNCSLESEKSLNNMHLKLSNELVEFFEKSELSETVVQWRKSTEVRFKTLHDEHKAEAKNHCDVLRYNHECKVQINKMKQTYHQQLQAEIICVASDTALTVKRSEKVFNNWWQKWTRELTKNIQPIALARQNHMELEITAMLHEMHYAYAQLIIEGLKLQSLSKRGTMKLDIIDLHLHLTNWLNIFHWHAQSSEDLAIARTQTQLFLHQVEKWMQEITEGCEDFNKSSVAHLLMKLQKSVVEFNNENHVKRRFTFTPQYQVDIAIIVAGYTYQKVMESRMESHIEMEIIAILDQIYYAYAHLITERIES